MPPAASPAPASASSKPAAPIRLQASDTTAILQHTGSRVQIEGIVSRIGESRSGDVLYVNFMGNTRGELSLVQFTKPERKASDFARLNDLVGKRILAEGTVSVYRDAPQIVITQSTPISVLAEN